MDAIVAEILSHHAAFDPNADKVFFAALPAKWCVALLCDAAGEPLQLMCANNLRTTLKRRLEVPDETSAALPTKRIDYRELVRSVRWRRVDGEFEMDLAYVDAARACFAAHWRRLVPERSAHFVACDANAAAPDFVRDTTPLMAGSVFGRSRIARRRIAGSTRSATRSIYVAIATSSCKPRMGRRVPTSK